MGNDQPKKENHWLGRAFVIANMGFVGLGLWGFTKEYLFHHDLENNTALEGSALKEAEKDSKKDGNDQGNNPSEAKENKDGLEEIAKKMGPCQNKGSPGKNGKETNNGNPGKDGTKSGNSQADKNGNPAKPQTTPSPPGNPGTDKLELKSMDDKALLEEARKMQYWVPPHLVDPDQFKGKKIGSLDPEGDSEYNKSLEVINSRQQEILAYERRTSFIKPLGELKGMVNEAKFTPTPLTKRGVILLDTSRSMVGMPTNFYRAQIGKQEYEIYAPAVLATTLAQYYVGALNTEAVGMVFSGSTHKTTFTKDIGVIAQQFSKVEGGGTIIGYVKLKEAITEKQSSLDIYIITDADILGNLAYNVGELKSILSASDKLERIFYINWGAGTSNDKHTAGALRQTGMKNVYYSYIEDVKQIPRLRDDIGKIVSQQGMR